MDDRDITTDTEKTNKMINELLPAVATIVTSNSANWAEVFVMFNSVQELMRVQMTRDVVSGMLKEEDKFKPDSRWDPEKWK